MGIRQKLVDASRDTLASIENRLAGVFRPVAPRREFVSGLQRKIQVKRQAIIERFNNLEFLLLFLAGVIASIVLVALGVRALLSLLAALGVIHQTDRQIKKRAKITPSRV